MNKYMFPYILNLSPDAAEGGVVADPFSEAAEGVDTTYPVLKDDKIWQFEVVSCKRGPSKESAEKSIPPGSPDYREMLTIKCKTTGKTITKEDKEQGPGLAITTYIGLTETKERTDEKGRTIAARTAENIKKDLATFMKATGIANRTMRELINQPEIAVGKKFDARTPIKKAEGSYPESNGIRFVLPG